MFTIVIGYLYKLLDKLTPEWSLRLGLGITYLYSGSGMILDPSGWIGFLPGWMADILSAVIPLEIYMRIHGGGEIIMALIFLVSFSPRILVLVASLLSSLEFASIILLVGIDTVTFRDIGLFGGSAALVLLITKGKKQI